VIWDEKKPTTNVSASILARLKILEKENLVLIPVMRYISGGFLARLAASKYVKKFDFKSGFLLLHNIEKARPTKEIDFSGSPMFRATRKRT